MSSRKRSDVSRGVIARALHEHLEPDTRRAYENWPDEEIRAVDAKDWAVDAEALRPSKANPGALRPSS